MKKIILLVFLLVGCTQVDDISSEISPITRPDTPVTGYMATIVKDDYTLFMSRDNYEFGSRKKELIREDKVSYYVDVNTYDYFKVKIGDEYFTYLELSKSNPELIKELSEEPLSHIKRTNDNEIIFNGFLCTLLFSGNEDVYYSSKISEMNDEFLSSYYNEADSAESRLVSSFFELDDILYVYSDSSLSRYIVYSDKPEELRYYDNKEGVIKSVSYYESRIKRYDSSRYKIITHRPDVHSLFIKLMEVDGQVVFTREDRLTTDDVIFMYQLTVNNKVYEFNYYYLSTNYKVFDKDGNSLLNDIEDYSSVLHVLSVYDDYINVIDG